MNIKYLGTGAFEGVPALFCRCDTCERARKAGGSNIRTRQQALLNGELLFDFNADTLTHVQKYGLYLDEIKDCLITHAHSDHLGDAPEIAARTGAAIVAIPEVLALCEERKPGLKQYPMNLGGSLTLPFGKVRMTLAQHSAGVAGGVACGYVVYMGGKVVYFAGDTALFRDMELIGQKDALDYALLPIGDNYTMGLEDAALAAQLLNVRHVIPIHYNTWPIINQDVRHYKEITEAMSRAEVHIIEPGGKRVL